MKNNLKSITVSMKGLIIGNCSIDNKNGIIHKGGPAVYQLPIFSALGAELDLLTSVDDEYVKTLSGFKNIYNLKTEMTTTFKFGVNSENERILKLIQKPIDYDFDIIPSMIFENSYNFVIFSGISGELEIDFITKLINHLNSDNYILDLQSLVRKADENGNIIIKKIEMEDLNKLPKINIIKGSDVEINLSEYMEKNYEKDLDNNKILIETTNKGRIYYTNKTMNIFDFEIIPEKEIIDDTGSGDIFLACFSWMFIMNKDIKKAIKFAHKVSSDLLRVNGVSGYKEASKVINKRLSI
tara:strand:- start:558 stop:1448 length:891 start_codon:yes stop_codon:yes gene_type:complete